MNQHAKIRNRWGSTDLGPPAPYHDISIRSGRELGRLKGARRVEFNLSKNNGSNGCTGKGEDQMG